MFEEKWEDLGGYGRVRKDLEVIVLPKRKKLAQMAIELLQEKSQKERAVEFWCLAQMRRATSMCDSSLFCCLRYVRLLLIQDAAEDEPVLLHSSRMADSPRITHWSLM